MNSRSSPHFRYGLKKALKRYLKQSYRVKKGQNYLHLCKLLQYFEGIEKSDLEWGLMRIEQYLIDHLSSLGVDFIDCKTHQVTEESLLCHGHSFSAKDWPQSLLDWRKQEKLLPYILDPKRVKQARLPCHHLYCFSLYISEERAIIAIVLFERNPLSDIQRAMIEHFLEIVRDKVSQLMDRGQVRQLAELVYKDDVTGLFNSRYLKRNLQVMIELQEQRPGKFCLFFIDLDRFKAVNDQFGHRVGSLLLAQFAQFLKSWVGPQEEIYRYGGDEFVVFLRGKGLKAATERALQLCQGLRKKRYEVEIEGHRRNFQLSASIGIGEYPTHGKNLESILEFADFMMFEAKKNGGGQIFYPGPKPPNPL